MSRAAASDTFSPALSAARYCGGHLNRLERTPHVVPEHPEQQIAGLVDLCAEEAD